MTTPTQPDPDEGPADGELLGTLGEAIAVIARLRKLVPREGPFPGTFYDEHDHAASVISSLESAAARIRAAQHETTATRPEHAIDVGAPPPAPEGAPGASPSADDGKVAVLSREVNSLRTQLAACRVELSALLGDINATLAESRAAIASEAR